MQAEQQPVLGILGGMGPLATIDFLNKLTRLQPARCDQDHLPWITLSQPGMPDRSQAIENHHDGPLPYLLKGVAYLAAQGVKLIAIPCSTSHFWFEQMQAAVSVPIVHIADATIDELKQNQDRVNGPVAVLATRGTMRAGIYQRRLLAAGIHVFELEEADQIAVDNVIRDVKSGNLHAARERMRLLQAALSSRDVHSLILGCTELPLAHDASATGLLAVDASLALAKAIVHKLAALPDQENYS